jgi:hypothetical protein
MLERRQMLKKVVTIVGIKNSLFHKRVFTRFVILALAGYAIVFMDLSSPAIGKLDSQTCFAGANQIEVVPYQSVSSQKLKNVAAAVEITETLLGETGFALTGPVQVVVTENETDYAGAIGYYAGLSPEKAAEKAGLSTGISLPQKPVIILQGIPRLEKYPVTAYIMLPHEIFHQAQKHDGIAARNTRAWFYEGCAEAFRYLALERAGFYKKGDSLKDTFNRLLINYMYNQKKELPPLGSLATYDSWEASLKAESQSGSPLTTVYPYAALAVLRLSDGDFSKIAGNHQLMREGKTFDTAFQEVFGKSAAKFEEDLTDSLNEEIKKFAADKYK